MIAIWGANGFIGRHTTHQLATTGRPLRLFARNFDGFPFAPPQNVSALTYDFTRVQDYITDLENCDTLILLVSATLSRTSNMSAAEEIENNVAPYQKFLTALKKLSRPPKHIIYFSSGGAIYGVTVQSPISETQALNPISPYGKSKMVIEALIENYAKETGCIYSSLRAANPIGIWSRKPSLIQYALNAARTHEPLTIFGDGSMVRDYFDVRELGHIVKQLTEKSDLKNTALNVGSGKGTSVHQIVDIIQTLTGKTIPLAYKPANATDVPYNVLDCTKIGQYLGWQSTADLNKVILEMWEAQ